MRLEGVIGGVIIGCFEADDGAAGEVYGFEWGVNELPVEIPIFEVDEHFLRFVGENGGGFHGLPEQVHVGHEVVDAVVDFAAALPGREGHVEFEELFGFIGDDANEGVGEKRQSDVVLGFGFVGVDRELGLVGFHLAGLVVVDLEDDIGARLDQDSGIGWEEMPVGTGSPASEGTVGVESDSATG